MGQLMYSPDQPSIPLQGWDLNRPMFVPNVQVPQQLQGLLPMASSMLANALMEVATKNPVRMYTLNKAATNNWNTETFAKGVWLILMGQALMVAQGRIRYPDQNTVAELAGLMSDWLAAEAACTDLFNANFIHPNDMGAFNQAYQQFGEFGGQINQFVQQAQQPQQPMYQQQPSYQGMQQQPAYQQYGVGGGMQPAQQGGMVQRGSFFNGQSGMMNPNSDVSNVSASKWDKTQVKAIEIGHSGKTENVNAPQFDLKWRNPEPTQEAAPEEQLSPVIETEEFAKIKDWKSSQLQPYLTYIAPGSNQERVLVKSATNTIVEQLREGDKWMDRSKHQIGLFGEKFVLDTQARHAAIEVTMDKVVDLRERECDNKIDKELTQAALSQYLFEDRTIYALNLQSAIFETQLEAQKHRDGDHNNVFMSKVVILNPKVIGSDHTMYLRNLSDCINFVGIARTLKSDIRSEDINRESKAEVSSFAYYLALLNRYFTDAVNGFCEEILLLKNLSIDSFIDDIDELENYLDKEYGELYTRAFFRFQSIFITNLASVFTEGWINEVANLEVISPESMKKISFIPDMSYVAIVDLFSDEIMGEEEIETSWLIKETISPWLFKLTQNLANIDEDGCMAHYLITRDEVVFKIQPALMANHPQSFTISRCKAN